MKFSLTEIWNWIKDKAVWVWQHWWVILIAIIGILIVIWFIRRLLVGIKSDNY